MQIIPTLVNKQLRSQPPSVPFDGTCDPSRAVTGAAEDICAPWRFSKYMPKAGSSSPSFWRHGVQLLGEHAAPTPPESSAPRVRTRPGQHQAPQPPRGRQQRRVLSKPRAMSFHPAAASLAPGVCRCRSTRSSASIKGWTL